MNEVKGEFDVMERVLCGLAHLAIKYLLVTIRLRRICELNHFACRTLGEPMNERKVGISNF